MERGATCIAKVKLSQEMKKKKAELLPLFSLVQVILSSHERNTTGQDKSKSLFNGDFLVYFVH